MGFWVEVKPLTNADWSNQDAAAVRAVSIFSSSVPQLNGQASYAFSRFQSESSGEYFYAFLAVGPLFSLLKYTRPAGGDNHIGNTPPMPPDPEVVIFNWPIFDRKLQEFTSEFLEAIRLIMSSLGLVLQPSWLDLKVAKGAAVIVDLESRRHKRLRVITLYDCSWPMY
jgi:hypothetical protein